MPPEAAITIPTVMAMGRPMKLNHRWLWLACVGVALAQATEQKPDAWSSASVVTTPTAKPALDWLVGRWCLQRGDTVIEETWLPARGDIWFAVTRSVRAEVTTDFEFIRIALQDGAWSFLAQPQGKPATAFARTAGGDNWVRFENPQHDFPTRIEYRREGDNLTATIYGPDEKGAGQNKEKAIRYPYQRCELLSP